MSHYRQLMLFLCTVPIYLGDSHGGHCRDETGRDGTWWDLSARLKAVGQRASHVTLYRE